MRLVEKKERRDKVSGRDGMIINEKDIKSNNF